MFVSCPCAFPSTHAHASWVTNPLIESIFTMRLVPCLKQSISLRDIAKGPNALLLKGHTTSESFTAREEIITTDLFIVFNGPCNGNDLIYGDANVCFCALMLG